MLTEVLLILLDNKKAVVTKDSIDAGEKPAERTIRVPRVLQHCQLGIHPSAVTLPTLPPVLVLLVLMLAAHGGQGSFQVLELLRLLAIDLCALVFGMFRLLTLYLVERSFFFLSCQDEILALPSLFLLQRSMMFEVLGDELAVLFDHFLFLFLVLGPYSLEVVYGPTSFQNRVS